MGKIRAICISKKKGIPKSRISSALVIKDHGIEGDAHAGNWHRQISLLAYESINKMKSNIPNIREGAFAENITTENVKLSELKIGDKLNIGNDVHLEITQIGKECHSKCAMYYKSGFCVMPTDGIFTKVLAGGIINENDKITISAIEQ